jgi:mono/diheme cytochrome c family protein
VRDNEKMRKKQTLENGKNLAFNICGQCHYDENTKRFTGQPMNDIPRVMGKIYSANLTHSAKYGIISGYTLNQFDNLLKTGMSNDGRYIPYMLRPNMSEDDIADIYAFFRSNDKSVAASDTVPGITHETALGRAAMKIAAKKIVYKKDVKRPEKTNLKETGKYLVDNLGCYHCHSKSLTSLNYLEPEKSKNYMEGGMKLKDDQGHKVYAANLTPDKETGIGNYTKDRFRKAVIKGVRDKGDTLHSPMPRFKYLTARQCDAIYAYLQSLPPVKHKVKGHTTVK